MLRYIHAYVSNWVAGPADGAMTLTEQGHPNPRGEAMVAELKWVHDMIRHDLGVIRQMAADAEDGRPAGALRAAVQSLASGSAVWQLKVSCLQHCRFVHSHHTHESHCCSRRCASPTRR